jgi:riboflavin kinase/FMN adenylyltransferase
MAAVMNLGPQPTVDPAAPSAVEVHLIDRRLELEGARLTVEPLQLLRRQCRFPDLEALVAQIGADAEQALRLVQACSADRIGMGEAPADEQADASQQQNA